MKISSDYDKTFYKISKILKQIVDSGEHEVCIVTARKKSGKNTDLYAAAKKAGITKIYFTNDNWKAPFLKSNKFDLHIDDNFEELKRIKGLKSYHVDKFLKNYKNILKNSLNENLEFPNFCLTFSEFLLSDKM